MPAQRRRRGIFVENHINEIASSVGAPPGYAAPTELTNVVWDNELQRFRTCGAETYCHPQRKPGATPLRKDTFRLWVWVDFTELSVVLLNHESERSSTGTPN